MIPSVAPASRLRGQVWKPEHRRAADRRGLRYPSDLTDAEWALIHPATPSAKRGGRRRGLNIREVLKCYFLCALDSLPMAGVATGPAAEEHGSSLLYAVGLGRHARACSSRALCSSARAQGARPALRPRLSIAKLPKPRKKGLCARPAGLRCGQEGQGPQAAHPGRYPWAPPECRCASRRPAESRWRRIGSRLTNATPISICRTDLRRRWLSGIKDRRHDHRDRQVENRNRQTRPTALRFVVLPNR